MYKRVRRLAAPLLALALAGACLCAAAGAAPALPQTALLAAGAFFTSPPATLRAAREVWAAPEALEAAAPEAPETAQQDAVPAQSAPAQTQTGAAESAAGPLTPEAPVPGEAVPEGMAALLQQHYTQGSGPTYIPVGAGTIRNCTELPDSEVAAEAAKPLPFSVEVGSSEPQVLIMHTHATECYESEEHSWCDPAFTARTTDTAANMVAVGEEMAAVLNAAGIATVHDTTLHDYPSYNGSYEASNATVREYLAQYPSIKVVLDVHRDAIQRADGTRVKPVVTLNGEKSAQVMLICGADNGGNLPNFRQNLRFAAAWEARMEALFPGLTRPVLFDYRYYNQDLTTGSLLIEVGGHANTLDEAKRAGRMAAQALAALLASP